MNELDAFLDETMALQIEAEEAIQNGDASPRLQLWSHKDPVTLFEPWGPPNNGWDEVSGNSCWIASRLANCTEYSFELVAAGVSGDLAYTVGYEHSERSQDGGAPEPVTLRVTYIYRRENREWKIVHRHGDLLPENQSASVKIPE